MTSNKRSSTNNSSSNCPDFKLLLLNMICPKLITILMHIFFTYLTTLNSFKLAYLLSDLMMERQEALCFNLS